MANLLTLFNQHPETGLPVLALLVVLLIVLHRRTRVVAGKIDYTYHDPRYTQDGGKMAAKVVGEPRKVCVLTLTK